MGIPHIYKKTDSALRGNIGAELEAMMQASGEEQLPFVPAFPQIGRTTVNGTHFIEGVPVVVCISWQAVRGLAPSFRALWASGTAA